MKIKIDEQIKLRILVYYYIRSRSRANEINDLYRQLGRMINCDITPKKPEKIVVFNKDKLRSDIFKAARKCNIIASACAGTFFLTKKIKGVSYMCTVDENNITDEYIEAKQLNLKKA